MRVLLWYSKQGVVVFDGTIKINALSFLYQKIKAEGYYYQIDDPREKQLFEQAEQLNLRAMEHFLEYRRDYEYENWEFVDVLGEKEWEEYYRSQY